MQCNLWNIRNSLFLSRNHYTVRISILSYFMNRFIIAFIFILIIYTWYLNFLHKYCDFIFFTKLVLIFQDNAIVIIFENIYFDFKAFG